MCRSIASILLRQRSALLLALLLLAGGLFPGDMSLMGHAAAQSEKLWLQVDTEALTLSVMQGKATLKVYQNIAIGSNGATWNKRVMDEKTPLGDFKINAIKSSARFQIFLSINYPTMDHAQRALQMGGISASEYELLRDAWRKGEHPPQSTNLGGHLGIHGIGLGSVEIHNRFNWTNGCIALTNEQIEDLAGLVTIGTKVLIR